MVEFTFLFGGLNFIYSFSYVSIYTSSNKNYDVYFNGVNSLVVLNASVARFSWFCTALLICYV